MKIDLGKTPWYCTRTGEKVWLEPGPPENPGVFHGFAHAGERLCAQWLQEGYWGENGNYIGDDVDGYYEEWDRVEMKLVEPWYDDYWKKSYDWAEIPFPLDYVSMDQDGVWHGFCGSMPVIRTHAKDLDDYFYRGRYGDDGGLVADPGDESDDESVDVAAVAEELSAGWIDLWERTACRAYYSCKWALKPEHRPKVDPASISWRQSLIERPGMYYSEDAPCPSYVDHVRGVIAAAPPKLPEDLLRNGVSYSQKPLGK